MDDKLRAIGDRLLAAAVSANAYGLAAVHIGEVAPVVVVSADEQRRDYLTLYNATVLATADATGEGEEGSVSLPGVRAQIVRPVWTEIGFMDASGAPQQRRFEGFAARVALHEIEQMQGFFFLDRLSRLKRDMLLKKARKLAG